MIRPIQSMKIPGGKAGRLRRTLPRLCLYILLTSSLLAVGSSQAADVEIYTSSDSSGVNPNVLFVIDTSGSMGGTVNISTYNPAVDYTTPSGSVECLDSRIYVGGINTSHPGCNSNYWFEKSRFRCKAGETNLDINATGFGTGFFADKFARWNTNYDNWYSLHSTFYYYRTESIHYECEDDDRDHGETDASSQKRIRNGSSGPWNSTITSGIWRNKDSRTLFTGNYLNWYHYHGGNTGTTSTRLQVVVDAAKDLIDSVSDIDIGIMRFQPTGSDSNSGNGYNNHGGPVSYPMVDASDPDNKAALKSVLDGFAYQGSTPLVETVYEGMKLFRGENVYFGLPLPDGTLTSHALSRSGDTYISPIDFDCGSNYMVVFSDGAPTDDFDADGFVNPLIAGANGDMGSCNHDSSSYYAADSCLDELSNFMFNADHATVDQGNDLPGKQNIISYYIAGFDAADDALMDAAAVKGGTQSAYSAASPSGFASVFNSIISEIQQTNASFTSPAVSVNALNRLRHNNDLYFALFEPSESPHWAGNVKKYRLQSTGTDNNGDGEDDIFIGDARSPPKPAVNATTGLFEKDALSYWYLDSVNPDGDQTEKGGAAQRLYDYDAVNGFNAATRENNVFTYLTDYAPNANAFDGSGISLIKVHENNADPTITGEDQSHITKATLGLVESFDDTEFIKRVKWSRGVDVLDNNEDGNYTDGRPGMGGVLHTEPILVNYATDDKGTPTDTDDVQTNVLFATTNDGYFHILKSEDSGSSRLEYSAIIPKSVLGRVDELYLDAGSDIAYRLDSNIDIWRYDDDNDGQITTEGNDHVYAYFGQRRGGNIIFAFDVTDTDTPKLLWEINPDRVPENSTDAEIGPFQYMGQTWSKPKHHKILTPNSEGTGLEIRDIIIFGGGYDHDKDDLIDATRDQDTVGNAIYIVDAKTGALIWWAGKTGVANVTPDFPSVNMKYGFAADIRILDINGDGIADKIFATDSGGQVWRFDINNSLNAGDPLPLINRITGGVIADLQLASSSGSSTNANNRRLYYAPDVAIVQEHNEDTPFLSIAVGSGYRAHPLNTTIADKFFLLKYTDIISTPANYSAIKIYVDDLLDITNLNFAADPPPALSEANQISLYTKGWYIDLTNSGEKALSESVTVDGNVIFSTFTPPSPDPDPLDENACTPNQGTGKTYVVSVFDASPVANLDGIGSGANLGLPDRSYNLTVSGIPPRPKVVFPDIEGVSGKIIVGREILPVNIANSPVLTFWMHQ